MLIFSIKIPKFPLKFIFLKRSPKSGEKRVVIFGGENGIFPFLYIDLGSHHFGHFLRNYIRTSGWIVCWCKTQYFWNQCNKCFNLRSHLVRLFPIFLYRIMTVRDGKIIFAISRGLSTDKHQKGLNVFLTSLWVIIAQKWRVSIIILEVGVPCGILTLWQFPDLQVELCEKRWELSRFSH